MNGNELNQLDWDLKDQPDRQAVATVSQRLTASLRPVRALPGDGRMIWLTWGAFVILSVALSTIWGHAGFERLTGMERAVYYAALGTFGALFATAAVQEIVPGSRKRVGNWWVIGSCVVALTVVASLLFRRFRMEHFVQLGLPCLITGTIAAGVIGCFIYILTRHGYVVAPKAAGIVLGCFAGLAGVTVLAIACPIHNAAHVAVWHLGTILVAGVAGWTIGRWRERV
ncbi:MAG TPA: NrsF family protein [Bryobacteraceae bacterium]|jgi:hypothetical protein|nr:NrsF family protein [Bryobacteraceae bacterium]